MSHSDEQPKHDILLICDSEHETFVKEIYDRLRKNKFKPYFGKIDQIPGELKQEAYEKALEQSTTCAVFISPTTDFSDQEHEHIQLAIQKRVYAAEEYRIAPVVLRDSEASSQQVDLPPYLKRYYQIDSVLSDHDKVVNGLIACIEGTRIDAKKIDKVDILNPYQGLLFFDEGQEHLFFGRDTLSKDLIERMKTESFLVLVGASGTGKSSLIRAGLLLKLRQAKLEGVKNWPIVVMEPTTHPIEALTRHLSPVFFPDNHVQQEQFLENNFRNGDSFLYRQVKRVFLNQAKSKLFIFIDHFEDLFIKCKDEKARQQFIDLLLYAVKREDSQITVVIGLRIDSYAQAYEYPELFELIKNKQITLNKLTREEVRDAIYKPAYQAGFSFEGELVELIINEFIDEPGGLPLLQQTLFELCDNLNGNLITHQSYQEIGGVRGAIANTADKALEQLSLDQVAFVKQILLRLVQPGEDSNDTRIRAEVGDLFSESSDNANMQDVVQILVESRLITLVGFDSVSNTTHYSIAHEALIRNWPVLQGWIDENREFIKIQRRLEEKTNQWLQNNRLADYLMRGGELELTQEWLSQNNEEAGSNIKDFIEASIDQKDSDQRKHERNLERQLASTKKFVATKLTANKQLGRLRNILLVLIVSMVLLAGLFYYQRNRAIEQFDIAKVAREKSEKSGREIKASQLALRAQQVDSLNTGLLVSVESILATQIDERIIPFAIESLRTLLPSQPKNTPLMEHKNGSKTVAYSSDGQTLAYGSVGNDVKVWDLQNLSKGPISLQGHTEKIAAVVFSPDGGSLATSSWDNTIRIWNLLDPDIEPKELTGHGADIYHLAYSPDGSKLVSGSADNTIRIWNLLDLSQDSVVLTGNEFGIIALAYSADGLRIASVGINHVVRLWNLNNPLLRPIILADQEKRSSTVAFSPDNKAVASGSSDGLIRVWDLEDISGEPVVLKGHEKKVEAITYSPDGKFLVSAGQDNVIRLWNRYSFESGSHVLKGHENWIQAIAVSPNSKILASASTDSTIRLWWLNDLNKEPLELRGHEGKVNHLGFGPNGQILVSAGDDEMVRIWDLTNIVAEPVSLQSHQQWVLDLSVQLDGKSVCSASSDGVLRIWNGTELIVESEVDKNEVDANEDNTNEADKIKTLAFGSHCTVLAIERGKNIEIVYPFEPNLKPEILEGHNDLVSNLVFNDDGTVLASSSRDGTIRLWNISKPTSAPDVLRKIEDGMVHSLEFSPDGNFLAYGKPDNSIGLQSLIKPAKKEIKLEGQQNLANCLAFSPDGRFLVSGDFDDAVRIWDLSKPKSASRVLKGIDSYILSVAYSPDGMHVAAASLDGTIRIWNLLNSDFDNQPIVLTGHESPVNSLIYNDDGTRLISGSDDGAVYIWRTDPQELIGIACDIAGRNLSKSEWDQYMFESEYHKTCEQFSLGSGMQ